MTFVRKRESASCSARATVLSHRFTQVGRARGDGMSFGRLGTWCGPVTVALAILAGCGGKGDEAAFTGARLGQRVLRRTGRGRCTSSTTVRRTISPIRPLCGHGGTST